MIKVKIKKVNKEISTIIPKYAKEGDGAVDLTATSKIYDKEGNVVYGTNLAFEIPLGFVGLLFPRSSNAKQTILLSNSVGVLDSGYRGEVFFKFKPSVVFTADIEETKDLDYFEYIETPSMDYSDYNIGDRIGQLIILPYPQVEFEEVGELSITERNTGGYGSTGN